MTAVAPMARVPFAPLDNPRLRHLANAKNRQNGASALSGKASNAKSILSPGKRAYEPSTFDEYDSENVDPSIFDSPSKKAKTFAFDQPAKPFSFTLTPVKSMPPPSVIPKRLSTPSRANISSPRTPMTAPAGRSPPRKTAGVFKNRRTSAPFSRIDPPLGSRSGSTLPFSLDAAISGTFSDPTPVAKSIGATIQESMPKNWFFEIYEDTPEEEAANLMEHSTLTLDLSSDEESSKQERDDRGKENTPPEGYDAPTASRAVGDALAMPVKPTKKSDLVRRKIVADQMDDGERSPLSDLETDPFFPEGLDKDSHVIVDGPAEKPATKFDVKDLFGTAVPFAADTAKDSQKLINVPVVSREGNVKGEVIVWEDSNSSDAQVPEQVVDTCTDDVHVNDENKA